jgi:nucleolar MIF4G domain-containing protein 1
MLEVITELKNNTKKKAKGASNLLQMQNLEKVFKSIISRRVTRVVEPPKVTLDDILSVETKGRWWLVGSAWKGNDDVENDTLRPEQLEASELLQVCREQRMNTDIRKKIFMTVMSSEDYVDCHARLLKLGLKERQERDIIRVLVHCCSQEEDYNQYYMYVIDLLCQNIGFKVTYQFTLWDFFKEIDEDCDEEDVLETKTINLANLTSDLIQRGSIQLSVLKTLSLTTLSSLQALFLKTFIFKMLSRPMIRNDQGYYKPWKSLLKQKDGANLTSGLMVFMQSEIKQLVADDPSGLIATRHKEIKRLVREGSLSFP